MQHSTKWGAVSFIGRHTVASILSIALPMIIVFVGYFLLLLIAVVTDQGLGGPLALPFGLLFAFLTSFIYTMLFLFPATALAELFTKSFDKWKHLIQIPASFLILVILSGIYALIYLQFFPSTTLGQWAIISGATALLLAIPLGVYWWTAKFSYLVIEGVRNAVTRIKQKLFG
jgi:hypothetical protein